MTRQLTALDNLDFPSLDTHLQHFGVKVVPFVSSGHHSDESTVFVSQNFSGDAFEQLLSLKKSIIHPMVIEHCIGANSVSGGDGSLCPLYVLIPVLQPLPKPKYPLYNLLLKDAVICLPVSKKNRSLVDRVNNYLKLIRFMGGQSRKDMKTGKSFERTHLIETRTDTENYRCAVIYGIPILFGSWLEEVWQHRDDPYFQPNEQHFLDKHKIKAFHNLHITFIGFSEDDAKQIEEKSHFEACTRELDGHLVEPSDQNCTHFVLNANKGDDCSAILDNFDKLPDYVVYKSVSIALNLVLNLLIFILSFSGSSLH